MDLKEIIDTIETMSHDEAEEINHAAVGRLNEIQRAESMNASANFKRGERVKFASRKVGEYVFGKVIKINTTTMSIKADSGTIWLVTSSLVEKAA